MDPLNHKNLERRLDAVLQSVVNADAHKRDGLSVRRNDDISVRLSLDGKSFSFKWQQMYSAPPVTYQFLRALVEAFGTEKIDVESDINVGGCDTCDYGSAYGHTLTITEFKDPPPVKEEIL